MWTDFVYAVGDAFTWSFDFFEFIQNHFNNFLLLLGFVGFAYWMNLQNKLSKKANVPSEVKDQGFEGWYKEEDKQIK
jgi:hypothetical protein